MTMSCAATFFHAGFWVHSAEVDSVVKFFSAALGFAEVSRAPRRSGGERVFLRNAASDYLEVLSSDDVSYLTRLPRHPRDRTVGVPHLCFRVADIDVARESVTQAGGEVVMQAPGDGRFGRSELGEHRILFVMAPGQLSLELFEFRDEQLP